MMAKQGGARPGAGRKRGSPNVKSAEIIAEALEQGVTPVEYMLGILRDEDADQKERQWAAEKCAPYIHPRPAPIPRTVEIDLPDLRSVESIKTAVEKVVAETALGNIAPGEAQSLISIIEAQRKTIETIDIVARIERLENQRGT